jgi:hypothetical protein
MNVIEFNFVKKFNNNELEDKTYFRYKGKEYSFNKYAYDSGIVVYSVHPHTFHSLGGMNVDKVTSKYISLYDYNMMSQRTNYKMALDEIKFFTPEK